MIENIQADKQSDHCSEQMTNQYFFYPEFKLDFLPTENVGVVSIGSQDKTFMNYTVTECYSLGS